MLVDIQSPYAHAKMVVSESDPSQGRILRRLTRQDKIARRNALKIVRRKANLEKRPRRVRKKVRVKKSHLRRGRPSKRRAMRTRRSKSITPVQIRPHVQLPVPLLELREEMRIPSHQVVGPIAPHEENNGRRGGATELPLLNNHEIGFDQNRLIPPILEQRFAELQRARIEDQLQEEVAPERQASFLEVGLEREQPEDQGRVRREEERRQEVQQRQEEEHAQQERVRQEAEQRHLEQEQIRAEEARRQEERRQAQLQQEREEERIRQERVRLEAELRRLEQEQIRAEEARQQEERRQAQLQQEREEERIRQERVRLEAELRRLEQEQIHAEEARQQEERRQAQLQQEREEVEKQREVELTRQRAKKLNKETGKLQKWAVVSKTLDRLHRQHRIKLEEEVIRLAEQRKLLEEQVLQTDNNRHQKTDQPVAEELTPLRCNYIRAVAEEKIQRLKVQLFTGAADDYEEPTNVPPQSWTFAHDSLREAMEASPEHTREKPASRAQIQNDAYTDFLLELWQKPLEESTKSWQKLFEEEENLNEMLRKRKTRANVKKKDDVHQHIDPAQQKALSQDLPLSNGSEAKRVALPIPTIAASYRLSSNFGDNSRHLSSLKASPLLVKPSSEIRLDVTPQPLLKGDPGSKAPISFLGNQQKMVAPNTPRIAASYRLASNLPSDSIQMPTPKSNVSIETRMSVASNPPSLKLEVQQSAPPSALGENPSQQVVLYQPRKSQKEFPLEYFIDVDLHAHQGIRLDGFNFPVPPTATENVSLVPFAHKFDTPEKDVIPEFSSDSKMNQREIIFYDSISEERMARIITSLEGREKRNHSYTIVDLSKLCSESEASLGGFINKIIKTFDPIIKDTASKIVFDLSLLSPSSSELISELYADSNVEMRDQSNTPLPTSGGFSTNRFPESTDDVDDYSADGFGSPLKAKSSPDNVDDYSADGFGSPLKTESSLDDAPDYSPGGFGSPSPVSESQLSPNGFGSPLKKEPAPDDTYDYSPGGFGSPSPVSEDRLSPNGFGSPSPVSKDNVSLTNFHSSVIEDISLNKGHDHRPTGFGNPGDDYAANLVKTPRKLRKSHRISPHRKLFSSPSSRASSKSPIPLKDVSNISEYELGSSSSKSPKHSKNRADTSPGNKENSG